MINLKKLFKRKKGQGALEYLFMIAAALIIIFVVVRYISSAGSQASQQSDIAALQSNAEMAKSVLQAKGWWYDNYYVLYDGTNHNLYISSDTNIGSDKAYTSDLQYETEYDETSDFTSTTFESAVGDGVTWGAKLSEIYNSCMDENDKAACYVLMDLQDAKPSS